MDGREQHLQLRDSLGFTERLLINRRLADAPHGNDKDKHARPP
jgi:hypothetical protein